MKKIRVLLTGGGTGAHISLVAVAHELKTIRRAWSFLICVIWRRLRICAEIIDNDIEFVPIFPVNFADIGRVEFIGYS